MKYKLIKEYPGSPKLGHIICCNDFTHNGIDRHSCSDYPEFWEQVVEKDYEILSFKQDSACSDLWTKFYHGWCRNSNGVAVTWPYTNDEILNNHLMNSIKYNIHSVKRLSDGEVFTVGDSILEQKEHSIIEYFELRGEDLVLRINHQVTKGSSTILITSNFTKLKQPLFTTEDGVDIYPGDKNSTVSLDTMELYTIDGLVGNNTTPEKGFKYFSTKEKAEEYVLYNKPCLNIQEVLNNIEYNPHWNISEFLKVIKMNLETTVKQKLNK